MMNLNHPFSDPGLASPDAPDGLDERGRLLTLLNQHIPSLSDEDEAEIYKVIYRILAMDESADVADLALRTCACGEQIDGMYEYVGHLREVFSAP